MSGDDYPAVRRLAWRAARRLTERAHPDVARAADWMAYDPTGPLDARRRAARDIAALFPRDAIAPPDDARVATLRAEARLARIEIGE